MPGTKGTDVSGKGDDGVLGDGVWVGGGVFVGDVKVVAADQSNA